MEELTAEQETRLEEVVKSHESYINTGVEPASFAEKEVRRAAEQLAVLEEQITHMESPDHLDNVIQSWAQALTPEAYIALGERLGLSVAAETVDGELAELSGEAGMAETKWVEEDLTFAGASEKKIWWLSTINGKPYQIEVRGIRLKGMKDWEIEVAFADSVAHVSLPCDEARLKESRGHAGAGGMAGKDGPETGSATLGETLNIRCPTCKEVAFLSLPKWEGFKGDIPLGEAIRVGLVCSTCHNEFLLRASLSQVITESGPKKTEKRYIRVRKG